MVTKKAAPSRPAGLIPAVEAHLAKASAPASVNELYAAVGSGRPRKQLLKAIYYLEARNRIKRHGSGRKATYSKPGSTMASASHAAPKPATPVTSAAKKTKHKKTKAKSKNKAPTTHAATAPRSEGARLTRALLAESAAKAESALRARVLAGHDPEARELARIAHELRTMLQRYH